DEARERGRAAQAELARLESEVAGVEEGEVGLDAAHEAAVARLDAAQAAVREVRARLDEVRATRATLTARAETLELSLERKDAAGAILASEDAELAPVLGSLAALLTVEPGYEEAVAAALGNAADALAVESLGGAVDVIRWLRADDAG